MKQPPAMPVHNLIRCAACGDERRNLDTVGAPAITFHPIDAMGNNGSGFKFCLRLAVYGQIFLKIFLRARNWMLVQPSPNSALHPLPGIFVHAQRE
jgi:hypothetical protein